MTPRCLIAAAAATTTTLLLLTTTTAVAAPKDSYRVTFPTDSPLPTTAQLHISSSYAGILPVNTTARAGLDNAGLFFWYFEQSSTPLVEGGQEKLVIWLNGGPGCSSLIGLVSENGPFWVLQDGVKANEASWNTYTNVLYVEQPVGTGFSPVESRTGLARNESQVADDFVAFMKNFYTTFPETASYDLYFAGESYAGRYIPFLAARILRATTFPLKGLLMGSPYLSNEQGSDVDAYAKYVVQSGLVPADQVTSDTCRSKKGSFDATNCFEDLVEANIRTDPRFPPGFKFNVYNIRQSSLLVDSLDAAAVTFLSDPTLLPSLHLPSNTSWASCSDAVYSRLMSTDSPTAVPELAYVLSRGIPTTVFVGDLDFICNAPGIERQLGLLANNTGPPKPWAPAGVDVGTVQEVAPGLTYVAVRGAGHMLPMDLPGVGLALLASITGLDLPSAALVRAPGPVATIGFVNVTGPTSSSPAGIAVSPTTPGTGGVSPATPGAAPPGAASAPAASAGGATSGVPAWVAGIAAVVVVAVVAGIAVAVWVVRRRRASAATKTDAADLTVVVVEPLGEKAAGAVPVPPAEVGVEQKEECVEPANLAALEVAPPVAVEVPPPAPLEVAPPTLRAVR
ncbi:Cell death protease [Phlyctochytrium bullatum]|nr:Cell death protease [Phlyctochytrium bullatum]